MQVLPNVILNYSIKSQTVRLDFTGKSVVAKLNALYDNETGKFLQNDDGSYILNDDGQPIQSD